MECKGIMGIVCCLTPVYSCVYDFFVHLQVIKTILFRDYPQRFRLTRKREEKAI